MTTADIVNSWFSDRLANGALARNTEAYNQAHAALPDLIARLTGDAPAAPDQTDLEPTPASSPAPAAGKKN